MPKLLTLEEVDAILLADDVQINMVDYDGYIEVAWEYYLDDGTYKR